MIELGRLRAQAGCDVAQALAIGQLRERHAAELTGATELADSMIATVTADDTAEGLPRKMILQLGEHQPADGHARPLRLRRRQLRAIPRSNRRHPKKGSLLRSISNLRNSNQALTGPYWLRLRAEARGARWVAVDAANNDKNPNPALIKEWENLVKEYPRPAYISERAVAGSLYRKALYAAHARVVASPPACQVN